MKRLVTSTIFAMMVLAVVAAADQEYSFREKQDFPAEKFSRIVVDMPRGDITLGKSGSDNIEVRYKSIILAGSRQEAEAVNQDIKFAVDTTGGELSICAESYDVRKKRSLLSRVFSGGRDDYPHVLLKLNLPQGKVVEINSSSGDIDIDWF